MAKFATYYFRYNHDFGPREWEKRQEHLASLFERNDSIIFGEGVPSDKQRWLVFHHCLLKLALNRDVNGVGKLHYNDVRIAL